MKRPRIFLRMAFWVAGISASLDAVAVETKMPPNLVDPQMLADPLPALRPNRPAAQVLAQQRREHPYLLFDGRERGALRARAATEPYRSLRERLRQHADRCLEIAIPPPADMRDDMPMFLPDGRANPEYAREEYATEYFRHSYLLRDVLPTLAFAYQLTGEERYARSARQWLLTFAARQKFAPRGREADFHLAQVTFAFALGYDWLWEILIEPERRLVREKLAELAKPMHEACLNLLEYPTPQDLRGALGGNHIRRTQGLFAVVPLALLYEVPDAARWLDAQITLHRDRLYPSAFAPNGEHVDMWDHFNTSLDDPMVFTVALQRLGGEDLFNDPSLAPRFRGLAQFYLFGLEEWFGDGPPNRHGWNGPGENNQTFSWLALARSLKDSSAQWLATRDHGLDRLNEVMAYILYDSEVTAVRPAVPKGSVYFPFSGQIRMCTNWDPSGLLVSYRCGPRIPKDSGDQNAFRIRFANQWLATTPGQVDRTGEQSDDFIYDLMAWFRGSPAQNLVLPQPDQVDDLNGYLKRGRIISRGGVQWGVYTIMDESFSEGSDRPDIPAHRRWLRKRPEFEEWLAGPETVKSGELIAVHLGEDFDYVCGEIHRSYHFVRPSVSMRHILLVKGGVGGQGAYILVCDELKSGPVPMAFAWQLHAGGRLQIGDKQAEIGGKAGRLGLKWLRPAGGILVRKLSPAPIAAERTEFVQYQSTDPGSGETFITAIFPALLETDEGKVECREVPAEGGWAVEVRSSSGLDTILFKASGAGCARIAGMQTAGTAAVCRRPLGGAAVDYHLGMKPAGTSPH